MVGVCQGCSRSSLFPPLLFLRALGISRAEDAESDAKGSGMISVSNSILPTASSAPEPRGNGPEVLILCSLSRMSRALCPGAPSSRASLGHCAPKQDGGEDLGDVALPPETGSRGVRRKSRKRPLRRARHGSSHHPWLHRPLKKGLHEHGASSRGLTLVLHGATPIPVPWAVLGLGEEAWTLGFSFFPGMESKLTGCRAQRQDSWAFPLLGEEQIRGG